MAVLSALQSFSKDTAGRDIHGNQGTFKTPSGILVNYLNGFTKNHSNVQSDCQYITGCRTVQVHLTYLPNGQQDGKAYVEFASDYDQQRALDRNDCSVGVQDITGNN